MTAVSQTGGPETVLCGELELPYALIGFVTDYANEVIPGEPTPVATLIELMAASPAVFADVLGGAVQRLAAEPPGPGGDHVPLRAGLTARMRGDAVRVLLMPPPGAGGRSCAELLGAERSRGCETRAARRWAAAPG